ncbi:MAG: hypothetical protein ACRES9_00750, partial [Gammaproteobacteria bacterium]
MRFRHAVQGASVVLALGAGMGIAVAATATITYSGSGKDSLHTVMKQMGIKPHLMKVPARKKDDSSSELDYPLPFADASQQVTWQATVQLSGVSRKGKTIEGRLSEKRQAGDALSVSWVTVMHGEKWNVHEKLVFFNKAIGWQLKKMQASLI